MQNYYVLWRFPWGGGRWIGESTKRMQLLLPQTEKETETREIVSLHYELLELLFTNLCAPPPHNLNL